MVGSMPLSIRLWPPFDLYRRVMLNYLSDILNHLFVEVYPLKYDSYTVSIVLLGTESFLYTSGKRGFYPPPLVPKLYGPGLKGALVPVRAAGARPAPSPGS
jgi:hypothetical protein